MRPRPCRAAVALALAAAIGVALTGCSTARWTEVRAVADPAFARGERPIVSIDLLPLDLQVWAHDRRDPVAIRAAFAEMAVSHLAAELAARGYAVGAQIDERGEYVGADGRRHRALERAALGATLDAMSSYGSAQTQAEPGTMLVPFLPHRLGEATAGDATLYVSGWAFAGEAPRPRGATVKKVLTVAAIAVVAIVIVVAILGGDSPGGLGGAAEGVAEVAKGTLQVAGRVAHVAARAVVHSGRVAIHATEAVVNSRTAYEVLDGVRAGLEIAAHTPPPPTPTHVRIVAQRPSWFHRPGAPRKGRSRLMLELTLIDNRTGRALWHARQELGADPTRPADVGRAIRHLLRSLPAR